MARKERDEKRIKTGAAAFYHATSGGEAGVQPIQVSLQADQDVVLQLHAHFDDLKQLGGVNTIDTNPAAAREASDREERRVREAKKLAGAKVTTEGVNKCDGDYLVTSKKP